MDWAKNEIQIITGSSFGDQDIQDIVNYCYSISIEEMKDYLKGILGESPEILAFVNEFALKRQPKVVQGPWKKTATSEDLLGNIASDFSAEDRSEMIKYAKTLPRKEMEEYFAGILGEGPEITKFVHLVLKEAEKERGRQANTSNKPEKTQSKKKKKESKEKSKLLLEKVGNAAPGKNGKPICECLASVHELVTNCLSCGKIVCKFEDPTECAFCGTSLQSQAISIDTSQQDYQQAQKQREKLLDFDRNSVARSQVHDAAADFDLSANAYNKWLTPEQRALALKGRQEQEEKEEEQKKRRVITIDLEKKAVFLEKQNPVKVKIMEEVQDTLAEEPVRIFRNPKLQSKAPKFIPRPKTAEKTKNSLPLLKVSNRLQYDDNDYIGF